MSLKGHSGCGVGPIGASMIAYVLLVALNSIVGITATKSLGFHTSDTFALVEFAIASGNVTR